MKIPSLHDVRFIGADNEFLLTVNSLSGKSDVNRMCLIKSASLNL